MWTAIAHSSGKPLRECIAIAAIIAAVIAAFICLSACAQLNKYTHSHSNASTHQHIHIHMDIHIFTSIFLSSPIHHHISTYSFLHPHPSPHPQSYLHTFTFISPSPHPHPYHHIHSHITTHPTPGTGHPCVWGCTAPRTPSAVRGHSSTSPSPTSWTGGRTTSSRGISTGCEDGSSPTAMGGNAHGFVSAFLGGGCYLFAHCSLCNEISGDNTLKKKK